MSLLKPASIAAMRSTVARALPDTATIQRKTTSNVGGEEIDTWAELGTVPCRIAPLGGGEDGEAGGRVSEETTHIATFMAGTDVTEADRFVIGGTTYEATHVGSRGEWELARRVECREAL